MHTLSTKLVMLHIKEVLPLQIPIDGDASLLTEDYLYNVFLFPVNKAEALAYLDEGGPLPARYAKVIAVRGAHSPPDVMEYKVRVQPLFSSQCCLCICSMVAIMYAVEGIDCTG